MWKFMILFLLLILIQVASAAPSTIIVMGLRPKPGEKNYYEPRIVVTLSAVPKQNFNLTLKPAKQVSLTCKGWERVWECKSYTILRPKTEYIAILTSSRYFSYQGRKTKNIRWTFRTTDKQSLYEQWENYGLEEKLVKADPLRLFIPSPEQDHFKIEQPDAKGRYTVILYAIFNAGVNGPPIAEQEKEYNRQLKEYKKEALAWIKNRCQRYGVNQKEIKINWIPPEAAKY